MSEIVLSITDEKVSVDLGTRETIRIKTPTRIVDMKKETHQIKIPTGLDIDFPAIQNSQSVKTFRFPGEDSFSAIVHEYEELKRTDDYILANITLVFAEK